MITRENLARDILRLIIWYPVRWIVNIVPIKYAFNILRWMGDIHYFLSKIQRTIVLKNLQTVFLDEKLAGAGFFPYVIRQYFRNHYVNRLQILILPRLNKRNIEKIHTFEGIENLNSALSGRKGCILVHPHFGPLFLPVRALKLEGYPVAALVLTTDEGLSFIGQHIAYRLRVKYENKMQVKLISVNSFLRPLFECMEDNMVLFTIGDGSDDGKLIGKFLIKDFLGGKMPFPRGAAILAKKTGSPILPIFTILQKDDSYRTIIHEPINVNADISEDDILSTFIEKMESYIVRYPHLWHFWDEFNRRIVK